LILNFKFQIWNYDWDFCCNIYINFCVLYFSEYTSLDVGFFILPIIFAINSSLHGNWAILLMALSSYIWLSRIPDLKLKVFSFCINWYRAFNPLVQSWEKVRRADDSFNGRKRFLYSKKSLLLTVNLLIVFSRRVFLIILIPDKFF